MSTALVRTTVENTEAHKSKHTESRHKGATSYYATEL